METQTKAPTKKPKLEMADIMIVQPEDEGKQLVDLLSDEETSAVHRGNLYFFVGNSVIRLGNKVYPGDEITIKKKVWVTER